MLHKPSPSLEWKDGLIDEYDESQSSLLIEKRYKNSVVPIQLTLEKLKTDENFKEVVRKLRSEGWKDWHILMAMALVLARTHPRSSASSCCEAGAAETIRLESWLGSAERLSLWIMVMFVFEVLGQTNTHRCDSR